MEPEANAVRVPPAPAGVPYRVNGPTGGANAAYGRYDGERGHADHWRGLGGNHSQTARSPLGENTSRSTKTRGERQRVRAKRAKSSGHHITSLTFPASCRQSAVYAGSCCCPEPFWRHIAPCQKLDLCVAHCSRQTDAAALHRRLCGQQRKLHTVALDEPHHQRIPANIALQRWAVPHGYGRALLVEHWLDLHDGQTVGSACDRPGVRERDFCVPLKRSAAKVA